MTLVVMDAHVAREEPPSVRIDHCQSTTPKPTTASPTPKFLKKF